MKIEFENVIKHEFFGKLAPGTIFSKCLCSSPCIKTDNGNYVYLDSGMEIEVSNIDAFLKAPVIVYSDAKISLEY